MHKILVKDNEVLTWSEFKKKAKKEGVNYNERYLKTEHDHTVAAANIARQWKEFEADKDIYPNLQFHTVGDNQVRDDHKQYDGLIAAVDDPIWLKLTIPLDWGCRCYITQTTEPVNKEKYDINFDSIKEVFKNNPAKSGEIFKNCEPYNQRLSNKDKETAKKLADKVIAKKQLNELGKIIRKYKNGGKVVQCDLVDVKANDYQRVLEVADFWAQQGDTVEILPKLNTYKDPLYNIMFKELENTKYFGKMPDLKRNNVFYEHEGFTSENLKSAFKKMCNRGFKQSSKIVIDDCGLKDGYMIRSIIGQVKSGVNVEEVWIRKDKKLRLLYKKTEGRQN